MSPLVLLLVLLAGAAAQLPPFQLEDVVNQAVSFAAEKPLPAPSKFKCVYRTVLHRSLFPALLMTLALPSPPPPPAPPPAHAPPPARRSYLDTIAGVVLNFRQFQDKNASSPSYGKIIDPYAKSEIQYSTPTFANAGALLLKEGFFNASLAAGRDIVPSNTFLDRRLTQPSPRCPHGRVTGDDGGADGAEVWPAVRRPGLRAR
jgi:hypothetical protein